MGSEYPDAAMAPFFHPWWTTKPTFDGTERAASAAMLSAHLIRVTWFSMILSQPGAWSAEPRLKRLTFRSMRILLMPRVMPLVSLWCSGEPGGHGQERCDEWRRPHPEQPFGGPEMDEAPVRQHGGSGLKSTTGGCPLDAPMERTKSRREGLP